MMVELFEFEVHKDVPISELYVEQFIENILDHHSLFWGGGYDLHKITGVISTPEEAATNINLIIREFVNYFSKQDRIIMHIYSEWFAKIAPNTFINDNNLRLMKCNSQDLI